MNENNDLKSYAKRAAFDSCCMAFVVAVLFCLLVVLAVMLTWVGILP